MKVSYSTQIAHFDTLAKEFVLKPMSSMRKWRRATLPIRLHCISVYLEYDNRLPVQLATMRLIHLLIRIRKQLRYPLSNSKDLAIAFATNALDYSMVDISWLSCHLGLGFYGTSPYWSITKPFHRTTFDSYFLEGNADMFHHCIIVLALCIAPIICTPLRDNYQESLEQDLGLSSKSAAHAFPTTEITSTLERRMTNTGPLPGGSLPAFITGAFAYLIGEIQGKCICRRMNLERMSSGRFEDAEQLQIAFNRWKLECRQEIYDILDPHLPRQRIDKELQSFPFTIALGVELCICKKEDAYIFEQQETGQPLPTPQERKQLTDNFWRPECKSYYWEEFLKELQRRGINMDDLGPANPLPDTGNHQSSEEHTNGRTNMGPSTFSSTHNAVRNFDGDRRIRSSVQNMLKQLSTKVGNKFLEIPSLLQRIDGSVRGLKAGVLSPAPAPKPIPLI